MNILEVTPFAYQTVSGVSEHVRNIAERLAQRHSVKVYATGSGAGFPKHEIQNNVSITNFRCYSPGDAYFFSRKMMSRLLRTRCDIVQGHFYHTFPFHMAPLAKSQRFIATPHYHGAGHTLMRSVLIKMFKLIGERTLKKADKIISVSRYEKSLLIKEFGLNSERIVVIPNGVDLNSFVGLRKQEHRYISILYVGCLRSYKGVKTLIEVMPKMDPEARLNIVGIGPLDEYLKEYSQELKVQDKVIFSGYLPRQKLLQEYASADVFVLLSRYEAYSLVVAEALVAGTPCIVANTSALSEWVDNETCFGIDVPVRIDRLARLIKNVYDKHVTRKLTNKWIGTKILDWKHVVERLEKNFYD